MQGKKLIATDLEKLFSLNVDYVAAVQDGNIARFEELLAEDFYCSNPDGGLLDRQGFLAQTANPVTISKLRAHDVLVRQFGEIAIIHARTSYLTPDGHQAQGRYTDVWKRYSGTWKAISAHVTRC
jgi:ketosteroid isomerase-like protein